MARKNKVIPNGHFHKKWQSHRTRYNQYVKKLERRTRRNKKIFKVSPCPVNSLRPVVRCPSVRYHTKTRVGRGFTIQELKAVGLNKRFARTISISVDHRRRNKSLDSLQQNTARLYNYLHKMRTLWSCKNRSMETILLGALEEAQKINDIKPRRKSCKAKVPTAKEKAFKAFDTLRQERGEKGRIRRKLQRQNKEELDRKRVLFLN